jgi:hypothetical protein
MRLRSSQLLWIRPFNPVYEGDDSGESDGGGSGSGDDTLSGGGGGSGGGGTEQEKKFSQADINKFLAEDRKKHQKQRDDTVKQLENLRKSQSLTAKERDELTARIEEIQNQALSKEELAKKERDKILNDHKAELTKAVSERDTWKNRYNSETTVRAITDAAVDNDAINPRLVVAFLQPNTRLVEDLDDEGKPAGTFTARVKFQDADKEGKPINLDLTVPEAVKRMREITDQFGSLFKTSSQGGVGGSGNADAKNKSGESLRELMSDPVKYREWRKKNKDLDLSKLRR